MEKYLLSGTMNCFLNSANILKIFSENKKYGGKCDSVENLEQHAPSCDGERGQTIVAKVTTKDFTYMTVSKFNIFFLSGDPEMFWDHWCCGPLYFPFLLI